jgi:hypothetical protein
MQNVPKDLGRRIQQTALMAARAHLEADLSDGIVAGNGESKLSGATNADFGGGADAFVCGAGVFAGSAAIQAHANAMEDWAWLVKAAAELCDESEAA